MHLLLNPFNDFLLSKLPLPELRVKDLEVFIMYEIYRPCVSEDAMMFPCLGACGMS